MKNIQIIDGADNCTYEIFSATDEEFNLLFPEFGQDIEFIEDVRRRVPKSTLGPMMTAIWARRLEKPCVQGIHGTLFYELDYRKKLYPSKRTSEW